MSEWMWRFGPVGYRRAIGPNRVADMGSTVWRPWVRVVGRFYWSPITLGLTRHMGMYWSHPSVQAWLYGDDV